MSSPMKNPFMPFIKDFEAEAENFLIKYGYEDALVFPQRIDIRDIITRCMSLQIIESENLSSDMSVQGIITFSKGIVQTYNWTEGIFEGYEVDSPSVFVDSDVINEGYLNIILAHEAFHWYRHRQYFVYQNTHGLGEGFAFRCDKKYSAHDDGANWTDEQKMEWQARKIAPMILLPRNALIAKVKEVSFWDKDDKTLPAKEETRMLEAVSDFFGVTSYTVAKRLHEMGFNISDSALNYYHLPKEIKTKHNKNIKKQKLHISLQEAFEIYQNNTLFREYIESGLFAYRGIGFFTKIQFRASNVPSFLTFEEQIIPTESNKDNTGIMFHKNQAYEKKKTFRNTPQNAAALDQMSGYANMFAETHKRKETNSKTANELLWGYMVDDKWNTSIFQDRTLLSPMDYTRIQKPDHRFKLPAYMAMAVGLGLSLSEFQFVIKQAGLSLIDGDKQDDAYTFVLSVLQGRPIDECNDFLETIGLPALGTHSRDEGWSERN